MREFDLIVTGPSSGFTFTRDAPGAGLGAMTITVIPRVVDVYIRRVREKIEPDPAHPRWLITRWGVGYAFEA